VTKSVTELINTHALRWEERRRTSQHVEAARAPLKPTITLCGEYGSEGPRLGVAIAERLGFDFYDRELLERIVASANASRKVVESLDNRVQDWITNFISNQFEEQRFTSGEYLRHLSRVVLALGHHGRAVIMGRGAHYILDPSFTLKVRTIAPLAGRIACVSQTESLTEKEARATIVRKTAERRAFCRLHFDRDVSDPDHYDLIINTASTSQELNVDFVVQTFRARFPD
jgi:cytidylate kinase